MTLYNFTKQFYVFTASSTELYEQHVFEVEKNVYGNLGFFLAILSILVELKIAHS